MVVHPCSVNGATDTHSGARVLRSPNICQMPRLNHAYLQVVDTPMLCTAGAVTWHSFLLVLPSLALKSS
jgi:hypothetical protein